MIYNGSTTPQTALGGRDWVAEKSPSNPTHYDRNRCRLILFIRAYTGFGIFDAERPIKRTPDPEPDLIKAVQVNHGGPYVLVSKEILDRHDVNAVPQKLGRERMPECVAPDMLNDRRQAPVAYGRLGLVPASMGRTSPLSKQVHPHTPGTAQIQLLQHRKRGDVLK